MSDLVLIPYTIQEAKTKTQIEINLSDASEEEETHFTNFLAGNNEIVNHGQFVHAVIFMFSSIPFGANPFGTPITFSMDIGYGGQIISPDDALIQPNAVEEHTLDKFWPGTEVMMPHQVYDLIYDKLTSLVLNPTIRTQLLDLDLEERAEVTTGPISFYNFFKNDSRFIFADSFFTFIPQMTSRKRISKKKPRKISRKKTSKKKPRKASRKRISKKKRKASRKRK